MQTLKKYLSLFAIMLKIGLFAFGGGYAVIALIEGELVEKKKWLGKEEFLDMVAIAESTPGPVAVNAATYVGYRQGKFPGSLLATIAVCLPSFFIIYAIALFFESFLSVQLVNYAFRGIRVGVVVILITAGIRMLAGQEKTFFSYFIFLAVTASMIVLSLFSRTFSSIWYIPATGALGVIVYAVNALKIRKKREKEGKEDDTP